MKTTITLLLLFLSFAIKSQVTGNAFLSGQTNHSGIKIKFIKCSITANTDSTYTTSSGSYSISLSGGLYQILFSKLGYQDLYFSNSDTMAVSTTSIINNVTLYPGTAIYIAGNVCGNWTNNNVYILNGNITIPSSCSLNIQAGTIIKFDGNYSITAIGPINALGTLSSPIIFTSNFSPKNVGDWNEIAPKNSSCVFDNCIIEFCKIGFNFSNCSPQITNSIIRDVSFGIYCLNGSPLISKNEIYNMSIGIWVEGFLSGGTIECNHIHNSNNYTNWNQYGIITKSNNIVYNNIVHDIYSTSGNFARGIWVSNQCTPRIENNFIYNNKTGIDIGNSVNSIPNPLIVNNTIVNNNDGIIFHDFYADGTVINNIIIDNQYGVRQVPSFSTTPSNVSYNLVWNNSVNNFDNVQIIGIGQIVATNSNGDPVDSYFNLSQDPLFVGNNPPALTSSSPCLNAGDSTYRINLGFVNFCSNLTTVQDVFFDNFSIFVFPNPTNGIFTIQSFEKISQIEIVNVLGEKVYETPSPMNVVELPSGLEQGVYFLHAQTNKGTVVRKIVKE